MSEELPTLAVFQITETSKFSTISCCSVQKWPIPRENFSLITTGNTSQVCTLPVSNLVTLRHVVKYSSSTRIMRRPATYKWPRIRSGVLKVGVLLPLGAWSQISRVTVARNCIGIYILHAQTLKIITVYFESNYWSVEQNHKMQVLQCTLNYNIIAISVWILQDRVKDELWLWLAGMSTHPHIRFC